MNIGNMLRNAASSALGKFLKTDEAGITLSCNGNSLALPVMPESFSCSVSNKNGTVNINNLGENLRPFDIIINTVPHIILTEQKLEYVKKETLLIDLASNPGGIDKKAIKDRNLKFVWALSLPGKVAPTTSAEFIKNTIYNILREIYKV